MGKNNYVNFHRHCHYSNIISPDCAIKPIDYINRAIELNQTAISCVQHGTTAGYFEYYELCKKHNLKFIYGSEVYISLNENKEDKTNAHMIILSKNQKGFKILNSLLSRANTENYYYKARISLEWLLSLPKEDSDNIVITTACVGGIWKYDNYEEIIIKLNNKFKNNFYLEVQYHNTQSQKNINCTIIELSNKYKIPIIMGCDSHMIYEEQKKDRDAFLYAKGISYEDEEGWFLDYPSYEECFNRFEQQGILKKEEIISAIKNTNICLSFDSIEFNNELKIPSVYPNKSQKEKNEIFKNIILEEAKKKFGSLSNIEEEYKIAIKNEVKVVIDTNMADYFILNYYIIKKGIEKGGKLTLTSRGSCPSFYINNLLGFTTIDRVKSPVTLYPERFATVERVLAGSVFDIDFNIADRQPFIDAQNEILGEDKSYWLSTYGTLKVKSSFKMYAKANDVPFEISNNIIKYIDKYESAIKYAEEEEKENINPDDFIPSEYREIFNNSKKYNGLIDSISAHPCAFILSPFSISDNIGIIKAKDFICANIEGKYMDKYMYMKNDLLAVTVVDIIYKTFEKIGITPFTTNELMEKIKSDNKTWDVYKNGNTIGVNQVEQPKAREKIMKYKPKNISELSAFVCAIRPSFQSMINVFLNREDFSYNIPDFDNLLITEELPQSFLLTQEQVMKVLGYVGFEISESYTILKSIAKKKQGVVEPLKNRFVNGFIEKGNKKEEAETVWQIIQDSSNYLFNSSHALSVALDSVYGAYLKAHYPLEFYTTMIEIYTEKKNNEKVASVKQEMKFFNIKEGLLRFGENNSKITYNKEKNTISSLLASIKDINKDVGERLYELSKQKKYYNFLDLLKDIKEQKVLQSNQLEILIKLDYFSEFGKSQYLLDIVSIYENFYSRKQISKSDLVKLNITSDIMERFSNKQTEKLYKEIDNEGLVKYLISELEDKDISLKEKLSSQKEYIGYIEYVNEKLSDNFYYVLETKFYQSKNKPYLKLYRLKDGNTVDYRINDGFEFNTFKEGDIIKIIKEEKKNKSKLIDGKWVKLEGEFNNFIKSWQVL